MLWCATPSHGGRRGANLRSWGLWYPMGAQTSQSRTKQLWALARRQHWVVSRWQLLELGFSPGWIKHRIATGRLHPVHRGVYAVGRRALSRYGIWMAAVLIGGRGAGLSHESAAVLWDIRPWEARGIEVSVRSPGDRRPTGITVHRRFGLAPGDFSRHRNIPVTSPVCTLVDLATRLTDDRLEAAVNEADKLDLVHPEALRAALEGLPGRRGASRLRKLLDRKTFTGTDTWLERAFLPIARRAGLPKPKTQEDVNGFQVDFYWPDVGLVVETDGGRYHRTPGQQTADRVRDQTHTAAGLTCLRFTRAQVRYEPDHVERTLAAVANRLQ